MKREEKRKLKAKEGNAMVEFQKTERKFFKNFKKDIGKIEDPRHQSYIDYRIEEVIYPIIMKNACNLQSMREMTESFNTTEIIRNMGMILRNEELEELPHYVTINDCLKKMNPKELEKIRTSMIKALIRRKTFYDGRLLDRYWPVVVDATHICTFKERHCKHCLTKTTTNEETGEKKTIYYHNVLEAKIVFSDNMILSIGTEFVENEKENVSKQDCEINAFKRLALKLKKAYPRLPICILGDSLYAAESIFKVCEDFDWRYIIRFKEKRIPSISSEFELLKNMEEKSQNEGMKWVNDISYNKRHVHVIEYKTIEKDIKKEFCWLTDMKIFSKKQAREIVKIGRYRWKIENEGFNVQKNLRYDITHANSLNYNAMKNHYLLIQISDILLQLYEKGSEMIKLLEKTIKNISSDLLSSFSGHITREDIFNVTHPHRDAS
jgi:hypothetical protein